MTVARWSILVAGLVSGLARAQTPIEHAVHLYQSMDDVHAAAAFRQILLGNPPGEVAGKAHLYLGLIAFQAFHPDQAREEFKQAIEANPAIDLPPTVSPKARIAFAEARRAVSRELEAPDVGQAAARTPPPASADHEGLMDVGMSGSAPPEATATAHAPASGGIPAGTWWLGGFGVGALGVGTVLGVLSNNIHSQDTPQPPAGNVWVHSISPSSFQTADNEALTADVLFGVGGALLVGAVIWALVGSGSTPASPTSPVAVAF